MPVADLPPSSAPRASVSAALAPQGVLSTALDRSGIDDSAPFTALLNAAVLSDAATPPPTAGKILPLASPTGSGLPLAAAAPEQNKVSLPAIKVPIKIASEMAIPYQVVEGAPVTETLDTQDAEVNKRLRCAPHPTVEPLDSNEAIRFTLRPLSVAQSTAAIALYSASPSSATIGGHPASTMPNLAAPKTVNLPVALAAAGLGIESGADAPAPSPPQSVNAARPEPSALPPQALVTPDPRSAPPDHRSQSAAAPDRSAAVMAPPPPAASALTIFAVANQGTAPSIELNTAKAAVTIDRTDHHALVETAMRARGEPTAPAVFVRNADFGPISIRFDAAGANLHAMLGSDDPDFRSSVIAAADQGTRLPVSAPVPSPAAAAALRDGSGDRPAGTGPGSSSGHMSRQESAPHQNLAGHHEPGNRDRQDRPAHHGRHDQHHASSTLAMIRRGREDDASRLPRRDAGIFA